MVNLESYTRVKRELWKGKWMNIPSEKRVKIFNKFKDTNNVHDIPIPKRQSLRETKEIK